MNRRGCVLIVDDDEDWCEELTEILQREGFQATSAPTIAKALELLDDAIYHVLVVDIRMNEADQANEDGINLLKELDSRGLSEATKVIMLSAYGTKERTRTAFKNFQVADFLFKEEFKKPMFLESVGNVFAEDVNVNLELEIHWQKGSSLEQAIQSLEIEGARVLRGTALYTLVATELEDLLCRLFYQAESILIRPLPVGQSGTGVLRIQPFYADGGAGQEVIVKFGDFRKVEQEYRNFKKYIQPFVGGGRHTMILDLRYTSHLAGLNYKLLGTANDALVDFREFYRHSDVPQIKEAIDRLFHETCSAWYGNRGNLQPLNLTENYQQLLSYTPQMLEKVLSEELHSVQGRNRLTFRNLTSHHTFTNPVLEMDGLSFICPTYICTTHGDCNPHNLLIDDTGHVWLIDFQETGQSHILRDVAMLDSALRFQLLRGEEATLDERLQMEEVLTNSEYFNHMEQLPLTLPFENKALAKVYAIIVHLRKLAHRLVEQNTSDNTDEYHIALFYTALNTLQFSSLAEVQREHALLSASLLVDQLECGR